MVIVNVVAGAGSDPDRLGENAREYDGVLGSQGLAAEGLV
jgi:hypothetical protein